MKNKREKKAYVAEITLNLPENVKGFNTGSSLDKWSHKRPRLKSTRKSKSMSSSRIEGNSENTENNEVEERSVIDIAALLKDEPACDETIKEDYEGSEIDPDIQKLLLGSEGAASTPREKEERRSKRRRKKTGKRKEEDNVSGKKERKKIVKTVSINLSKPPSPQTVQVIRVDVTSNYSFEEVEHNQSDKSEVVSNSNSCSKNHKITPRFSGNFKLCTENKSSTLEKKKDLELNCKRVSLCGRNKL